MDIGHILALVTATLGAAGTIGLYVSEASPMSHPASVFGLGPTTRKLKPRERNETTNAFFGGGRVSFFWA
jgi:hypothetical protein